VSEAVREYKGRGTTGNKKKRHLGCVSDHKREERTIVLENAGCASVSDKRTLRAREDRRTTFLSLLSSFLVNDLCYVLLTSNIAML